MRYFLYGFASAIALLALTIALIIYSGRAPVSAATANTPLLDWLLHTGYEQALARHAPEVDIPPDLEAGTFLFRGARNFEAMCRGCHLPPGARPTALSRGLKPAPPELTHIMRERTPAEAFWVLQNGVHFTGMPAIGRSHSDEDLWALVEFLQRAKNMSPEDYARVVELAGPLEDG
ncbi:c-type cytochrome [Gilvimarinus sp. F26214L]|uniref:c-type cytochrome n=1 Tax=Gilvimarinus sp. DZF01 TaxID=3461371 RepID=UPI0040457215